MKQNWMIAFLTISLKKMVTSFLYSEGIGISSEEGKLLMLEMVSWRKNHFKTNISETISLKLTISNRKMIDNVSTQTSN